MATLIAELVGFVVILFVLYRYVWPVLQKMVRDRQDTVQQQVEEAEKATRELEEAEGRLESAVAEARNEAARIRDDARADSQRIREELVEQAEREVERMKQRGEEQLAALREQIVRRTRAELGGQSMQLAERVVVESLSSDERRSSTVDRFLDDLDQLDLRAGTAESRQAAPAGGGAT
jgi:F-type H+-transporting ATPase subunit b